MESVDSYSSFLFSKKSIWKTDSFNVVLRKYGKRVKTNSLFLTGAVHVYMGENRFCTCSDFKYGDCIHMKVVESINIESLPTCNGLISSKPFMFTCKKGGWGLVTNDGGFVNCVTCKRMSDVKSCDHLTEAILSGTIPEKKGKGKPPNSSSNTTSSNSVTPTVASPTVALPTVASPTVAPPTVASLIVASPTVTSSTVADPSPSLADLPDDDDYVTGLNATAQNPETAKAREDLIDDEFNAVSTQRIDIYPLSSESKSLTSNLATGVINYPSELLPEKTHCVHGNFLQLKCVGTAAILTLSAAITETTETTEKGEKIVKVIFSVILNNE